MNKIKTLAKKITRADGHDSMEEGKWYDVHIVKDCDAQPALSDKKYIDLVVGDKDCFISTKRKYPAIIVKAVDVLSQHD